MKELILYNNNYKVSLSNKSEYTILESEMDIFTEVIKAKWLFKTKEWVFINTAFFVDAKPFQAYDWLNEEQQARLEERIQEYKDKLGKRPSDEKIAEWIEKLKKWLTI